MGHFRAERSASSLHSEKSQESLGLEGGDRPPLGGDGLKIPASGKALDRRGGSGGSDAGDAAGFSVFQGQIIPAGPQKKSRAF